MFIHFLGVSRGSSLWQWLGPASPWLSWPSEGNNDQKRDSREDEVQFCGNRFVITKTDKPSTFGFHLYRLMNCGIWLYLDWILIWETGKRIHEVFMWGALLSWKWLKSKAVHKRLPSSLEKQGPQLIPLGTWSRVTHIRSSVLVYKPTSTYGHMGKR